MQLASTATECHATDRPASRTSSKPELSPTLKGWEDRIVHRRVRLADILVVGQLAMSLVLLVTGALLVRGLLTARNTDIGFDPTHVASLSFNLQMNGYDIDRAAALERDALTSLRAVPGVVAVSTASRLPLAPWTAWALA